MVKKLDLEEDNDEDEQKHPDTIRKSTSRATALKACTVVCERGTSLPYKWLSYAGLELKSCSRSNSYPPPTPAAAP